MKHALVESGQKAIRIPKLTVEILGAIIPPAAKPFYRFTHIVDGLFYTAPLVLIGLFHFPCLLNDSFQLIDR